jgi:transposase
VPGAEPKPGKARLRCWHDGAYAGEKLETALAGLGQRTLEIVKRSDQAKGFEVLPRRWVVERTPRFGRNRRLAKDFETTIART